MARPAAAVAVETRASIGLAVRTAVIGASFAIGSMRTFSARSFTRPVKLDPPWPCQPWALRSCGVTSTESGGNRCTRVRFRDVRRRDPPQSRAERKERTRQNLLDVTLRLIAQRSLASLSLREVARDAGIVPTAFYRHFESMDALGVELVDESMRPLRQMIRDARRGQAAHGDIIKGTVAILGRARAGPSGPVPVPDPRALRRGDGGAPRHRHRAAAVHQRTRPSTWPGSPPGSTGRSDDLEMAADLMVSAMLADRHGAARGRPASHRGRAARSSTAPSGNCA